MKLIGITRVRNESGIIQRTLDHVANFVDEIHVYDDGSDDLTPQICKAHPTVTHVDSDNWWDPSPKGRALAEGHRQIVYETAVKAGADWVYCFDADEYIDIEDVKALDFQADSYYFNLFDFYITPEDVDKQFWQRKWMGREYRKIYMMFKVTPKLKFVSRKPQGMLPSVEFGGYVKHYGKAMSEEQWELDCAYYAHVRWKDRQPELRKRWLDRMGKAIHIESDFGRPLITWEERTFTDKVVMI